MKTTRFPKRTLAALAALALLVEAAPAQFGGGGGRGGWSGGGGGGLGRSLMQRAQQNSSRQYNNSRRNGSSQRGSNGSDWQNNNNSSQHWSDQVKSRMPSNSKSSNGSNGSKIGSGKLPDLSRSRPSGDTKSGKPAFDQKIKDLGKQFNRGSSGNGSGLGSVLDRVGGQNGNVAKGSGITDALRNNLGREMHKDSFQQRLKSGSFDKMFGGELTKRVNWSEQLKFASQGDVARRLDLKSQLLNGGGWSQSKFKGLVGPSYSKHCSQVAYCGPGWYPQHCYYPSWTPWVSWCWNYSCNPYWDPRPYCCRPIYYQPCGTWVYYDCPVWDPLPVVSCGTWVGVAAADSSNTDLQLQAVRFVDPGHPERNEGPRFRVWVHNASTEAVTEPFNVMLLAGNSDKLDKDLLQAGVTISAMKPDETQAIDIRLPMEVNAMSKDDQGQPLPFTTLHVVVDSHQQIDEASEKNNGAALARTEIDPIDPIVMESDAKGSEVADGSTVILAGEGLGPEPGQVVVQLKSLGDENADNKVEVEAEITGWCDQGVQITLPPLPLAVDTQADLVVIRGDGAMANPLSMKIVPQQAELPTDAPQVAAAR